MPLQAAVQEDRLSRKFHIAFYVAAVAFASTTASADDIEAGLWKVITRTETGGVIGPPHESLKCLTPEQTADLATTFSPVAGTINSVCAPVDRSLKDGKLTWHLVCKGQLDMDLSGEFNFDAQHHYSGNVHTRAQMAGMQMVDSQNILEGQWISACPPQ
jgi:Protein of unknown function (DUF3617)